MDEDSKPTPWMRNTKATASLVKGTMGRIAALRHDCVDSPDFGLLLEPAARYTDGMTEYGQFCSVARAHEALGGRWTLLVVRELLSGSRRFNDIRRGIPRISRTMLSERLQILVLQGAVRRREGAQGPEYELTEAGRELAPLIGELGRWGQRWLPRHAADEDLDMEPLLIDMQRRVDFAALPHEPLIVCFEIGGKPRRYLLLSATECSLCTSNPGFPERVRVRAPLAALVSWWRGDASFAEARRMGLVLEGTQDMKRSFPHWFKRYMFADIKAAPIERDRTSNGGAAAKRLRS